MLLSIMFLILVYNKKKHCLSNLKMKLRRTRLCMASESEDYRHTPIIDPVNTKPLCLRAKDQFPLSSKVPILNKQKRLIMTFDTPVHVIMNKFYVRVNV